MKQSEIKRYGDGIYSRRSKRRNARIYFVQYHWHDRDVGKARRITERVPADKDGRCRLESAKRLKARREKEKHRPDFRPPHIAAKAERKARAEEADLRAPLLYENAVEAFYRECIDEYARPEAVRAVFSLEPGPNTKRPGPVAEAFRGRYLDEVTRPEIRQYFIDRIQNTGPFQGRTRAVTRRAPEQEISFLSALYTFLQDAGHAIENPCHRPRTRRRDGVLALYRPKHEVVIPSDAVLRELMSAERKGRNGHDLIDRFDRALIALTYYTAARPESEPCRLCHGDVVFGNGEEWGSVTYRRTKTGKDRRLLLHPDAERHLRSVMEPVPIGKAEREAWASLPIFRRRGSAQPWDKSSYSKAWSNIRLAVKAKHPEISGMWLRDLRKIAKTRMIDAGVSELVVNRILGHQDGVTGRYYQLTDQSMQRALEKLTLKTAADSAAGQDGISCTHLSQASSDSLETKALRTS